MKTLPIMREGISRWLDGVTGAAVTWHGRLASRRVVNVVEAEDDTFTLGSDQASDDERTIVRIENGRIIEPSASSTFIQGSHVELILRPTHFLVQSLELPDRAVEFLDGIVRAQIDRLTPWRAADAAFGFGAPSESVDGRISVIVAAAPHDVIKPYVGAITELGAHSISVFTTLLDAEAGAARIKLLENEVKGTLDVDRVRRAVGMTLAAAATAAGLGVLALWMIDPILAARENALTQEIGTARATAVASREAASASLGAVRGALAQRKRAEPASLLILEALSKVLPDDTYLTELRIEANKLRLSGLTRDAPALIALIEQSGFTRASFFAPTTRSPSQVGERFHIEATIKPRS